MRETSMGEANCRILAEGVTVSNDTWETGLANNDLIIGPTGGGKTRGYVLPNLLSTRESFAVTDTKGALRKQVGGLLARRGFQVVEVDFCDLLHSPWGYNPFRFIRYDGERGCHREQDIITVAAALVPVDDMDDPFWEYAARNLLEALIGYTLECLPPEEHNLASVARLFAEAETGVLDELMQELCAVHPEGFAAMRWKSLQTCRRAEKMYGSIQGILGQKLSNFTFGGVQAFFLNENQVDFAAMSHRPTALFLQVSDNDFSLQNLTSLFYTQAIQALIAEADGRPDNRLQVPVRLYLDDFANLLIPDIDKTISVIRSREISVSIVLQSITQLEGLYGSARAASIVDNCDHLLYLGGQSLETARFIGARANKPFSTVLNMGRDMAWLFTRGEPPRQVRRYDLRQHPLYRQLSACTAARQTVPSHQKQSAAGREPLSAGL